MIHSEFVESEHVPRQSILVIDDEQAILDVVRRYLEIAGHQVRCANRAGPGPELPRGNTIQKAITTPINSSAPATGTSQRDQAPSR